MNRFRLSLLAFAGAAALAACQTETVATAPVSAPMAPAEAPAISVGDTWVWQDPDGSDVLENRVVEADGTTYAAVGTDGCAYTGLQDAPGVFLRWENCLRSTGSYSLVSSEGSVYPLTVGASATHVAKGTNDKGDTWDVTVTCTVPETARVAVPAGEFDTYLVRCEDKWTTREYYYAPEVGSNVIYRRIDKRGRTDRNLHKVLVSFTSAGTT